MLVSFKTFYKPGPVGYASEGNLQATGKKEQHLDVHMLVSLPGVLTSLTSESLAG